MMRNKRNSPGGRTGRADQALDTAVQRKHKKRYTMGGSSGAKENDKVANDNDRRQRLAIHCSSDNNDSDEDGGSNSASSSEEDDPTIAEAEKEKGKLNMGLKVTIRKNN